VPEPVVEPVPVEDPEPVVEESVPLVPDCPLMLSVDELPLRLRFDFDFDLLDVPLVFWSVVLLPLVLFWSIVLPDEDPVCEADEPVVELWPA